MVGVALIKFPGGFGLLQPYGLRHVLSIFLIVFVVFWTSLLSIFCRFWNVFLNQILNILAPV